MSKDAPTDSLLSQARLGARRARSSPAALTTTSWSAAGELPVDDWVEQGRWLGAVGRACGWWIGDWIRYGNGRYGEKYEEAARLTSYDRQSLMNMAYVAGRYEAPRRRQSLSFSHHAELAGLPSPDQELWLDRVEAGTLSVRALRFELREARRRAALRTARAATRHAQGGTRRLAPVSALIPPSARFERPPADAEQRCPRTSNPILSFGALSAVIGWFRR